MSFTSFIEIFANLMLFWWNRGKVKVCNIQKVLDQNFHCRKAAQNGVQNLPQKSVNKKVSSVRQYKFRGITSPKSNSKSGWKVSLPTRLHQHSNLQSPDDPIPEHHLV